MRMHGFCTRVRVRVRARRRADPAFESVRLEDPDVLSRILYTGPVPKIVPLSEARARLSELLDELERRHEHVVITRNGRPVAVLLPSAEYDSLEETLEILHDERVLEALRESEEDVRAGRLESLRDVRRELGLA